MYALLYFQKLRITLSLMVFQVKADNFVHLLVS